LGKLPRIQFPPEFDWCCWIERWDGMQDRYLLHREERFSVMVRLIGGTQQPVRRVLDLGCGTGSLMLHVLREFPEARVWGIDFDPTLLALAEKRLAEFGERVQLVEADFRHESWLKLLSNPIEAVISATALHWLSLQQLARLYNELAVILRPGGIFLNADHVRSTSDEVQRAWEQHRQQMRDRQTDTDADNWQGFWEAYGRALNVDIGQLRKELTEPWKGSEEGLPLEWHFEKLKASGFEAVDCFWRLDCDAVYGGIRGCK